MADCGQGYHCSDDLSTTNLIINYLPQSLSDEEFKSLFLSVGPIENCKIVRDKATQYSYGFGFVNFKEPADANRAIETLSGLQLQNKKIKVALARKGGDNIKGANLYVRNLNPNWKEEELNKLFEPYGKIIQSKVLVDMQTGVSKKVGFVLFDTRDQAENAIKCVSGKTPEGCTEPILVKFADDNNKKMQKQQMSIQYVPVPSFNAPGPMRNQMSRFQQRFNPIASPYQQTASAGQGYTLFVYNIGSNASESTLWQMFSPYGTVQSVNVIMDHEKCCCKGFGFVTMTNFQEAQAAVGTLNGSYFQGKTLQVSFKVDKNCHSQKTQQIQQSMGMQMGGASMMGMSGVPSLMN